MRRGIKRVISLAMAAVLLATCVPANNLSVVNAENEEVMSTAKSVKVGFQDASGKATAKVKEIPGYVEDIELDLKLTVAGEEIKYEEGKDFIKTVESESTVEYSLVSENYMLDLSDNEKASGTIDGDKSLIIKAVKPKYEVREIDALNTTSLEVGKTYIFEAKLENSGSVNLKDELTWSLSDGAEAKLDGIKAAKNSASCKVVVNDELKNDKSNATLTLKGKNGSSKTIAFTIEKKDLNLDISQVAGGDWENTEIVVKATSEKDAVKGVEITLVIDENGTVHSTKTTDKNGEVKFNLTSNEAKTYNLTAKTEGTGEYKSAKETAKIATNAKPQTIKFTESENLKKVTYGDKEVKIGTVSLDGPGNKEAYTAELIKGEGLVTVKEDGTVTLTPYTAGEFAVKFTKGGNKDYNEASTDVHTFDVAKKVVKIESVKATKPENVYNGKNDDIEVVAQVSGKVDEDVVEATGIGTTVDANAGEDKEVTAVVKLTDTVKYAFESEEAKLVDEVEVNTTVDVERRPLTVTVASTSTQWQNAKNPSTYANANATDKLIYNFLSGDEEQLVKAPVIVPTIPSDYNMGTDKNQNHAVTLPNVLSIDKDSADVGENYYIETVVEGSLTLTHQTNIEPFEHITVNNAESKNVYQNTDGKIFVSKEKCVENKNTIGGVVKFDFISTLGYNKVCCIDENGKETDVTNGLIIEKFEKAEEITKTLYLEYDANGYINGRTDEFKVDFTYDGTAPVVKIEEGTNPITLESLTEKITFGTFSNETKVVNISVEEPESESGVKSWAYCKVDVNEETEITTLEGMSDELSTEEKIAILKDSGVFKNVEFEEVEGKNSISIDLKKEEVGYYVVYVVAKDNVGNNILVGSNGLIIENFNMEAFKVSAVYEEDNHEKEVELSETTQYFNHDVELKVIASDNESGIYSGVKKATYNLMENGKPANPKDTVICDNSEKAQISLTELKDYKAIEYTKEFTGDKDKDGKDVSVKYDMVLNAIDFAGNKAPEKKVSFVIDKVAPEVSFDITTEEKEGALDDFYNADEVILKTEIVERYVDNKNIVLNFVKTNDTGSVEQQFNLNVLQTTSNLEQLYGFSLAEKVKKGSTDSDDKKIEIVLKFTEEADYSIGWTVTDEAGTTTTVEPRVFHIDRTCPKLEYTYWRYPVDKEVETFDASDDMNNPTYINKDYDTFDVEVKVDEKNFFIENAVYNITAVDSNNEGVTIPEDLAGNIKKAESWNEQSYRISMANNEANYSFNLEMYDKAGNKAEVVRGPETAYITLDKTDPDGKIILDGIINNPENKDVSWASAFIEKITFGLFGQNPATAKISDSDATSGVAEAYYYISKEAKTKDDLEKLESKEWNLYTGNKTSQKIKANRYAVVYQKLVDKAGNSVYYSSDGFIMDNKTPAPVIKIVPTTPGWNKGVYSAADKPGFKMVVTEPEANDGSRSGLKTVSYEIGKDGKADVVTKDYNFTHNQYKTEFIKEKINIDPEKFYSNDVTVTVTASDWSTNQKESETLKLKIDNKAPIVKFSFDKSDAKNGKYYNKDKVLTITVDERNFDSSYKPVVTSEHGGGYTFSGWSHNGEIHTGTVKFHSDGDFKVTFDCYDLAGNKSNTEKLDEITIDKTKPVMNVSYDNNNAQNGNYYNAPRKATVTITEHNFNSKDVKFDTNGSVGSWSSSGDKHTVRVGFNADNDYHFDLDYTDLAGNKAVDYNADEFTVDQTDPEIKITNVENEAAYKDTIAPTITITDTNFDPNGVKVTLTGVNNGEIDLNSMISRSSTGNGWVIKFKNFPKGMDDVYKLVVEAIDKAGNAQKDKAKTERIFSVNRDGSTYVMSDYTKELINKGYTNAPQDIVIEEINPSNISKWEVSYTKDGKIKELVDNKDYKVSQSGNAETWHKNTYTILASAFAEDGKYNINISTNDKAGNKNNNKVQSKTIEFVVDTVEPTLAISNLDESQYDEKEHEFIINVKDNAALSKVEVYMENEKGELVLKETFEAKDLIEKNGKISVKIDGKEERQKVKVVVYDEAGNAVESEEYSVLVTENKLLLFYDNKALFFGSIIGALAVIGGIIFLILKKKKDEEEKAK